MLAFQGRALVAKTSGGELLSTTYVHEMHRRIHREIVAQSAGDLSESISRTRGYENNVGPSPELDVQYRIANLVTSLFKSR